MATQLQIRRGTSTQVAAFTGAEGEIVVNTTNDSVHVNDGSTQGGFELARVDGSNWAITNAISTTNNISFGDSDKAIFGAGSDLQIYHDGNHSYIQESGTGNLRILAENFTVRNAANNENMIIAVPDGAVTLFNDSSARLATTSTGIALTSTGATDLTLQDTDGGFAASKINVQNGGRDLKLTAPQDIILNVGSSDVVTILNGGNFGVGTTTPDTLVELVGADPILTIRDSSTSSASGIATLRLAETGASDSLDQYFDIRANAGKLEIVDNWNEGGGTGTRVTLDDAGRVGIGTGSPQTSTKGLHVVHDATEGTPSFPLGEVIIAQRNFNSAQGCHIGIIGGSAGDAAINFGDKDDADIGRITYNNGDNSMRFLTNTSEVMRLTSSNNVGIGRVPRVSLDVAGEVAIAYNALYGLRFYNQTQNNWAFIGNDVATGSSAADLRFGDSTGEVMRLKGGKVGIGTNSPSRLLHLKADDSCLLQLQVGNTTGNCQVLFGDSGTTTAGKILYNHTGNVMSFEALTQETMRLDNNTVLIGMTTGSAANVGCILQKTGNIFATADGGASLYLRRLSSDGEILRFNKSSTTIGSIGVRGGSNLFVTFRTESSGDGCGLTGSSASAGAIIPSDGNGDAVDNHIDLGAAGTRFDDVFSTGGINTSDRNEKQDIEDLSDAEKRVAVACKALIKKFRWKSSVAEKGDDARIHVGIIAQDLRDAFTAEGLDPARYSMWCSDTWTDETSGEEVTRQSVRYNELLAFIISAI